jgi:hypothetical protein
MNLQEIMCESLREKRLGKEGVQMVLQSHSNRSHPTNSGSEWEVAFEHKSRSDGS